MKLHKKLAAESNEGSYDKKHHTEQAKLHSVSKKAPAKTKLLKETKGGGAMFLIGRDSPNHRLHGRKVSIPGREDG